MVWNVSTRERLVQLIATQIGTHRGAQAELSRRLGEKDDHWVSDRLIGKAHMKADELPRLAAALGVSPCEFFQEAGTGTAERVHEGVLRILREAGYQVFPPTQEPPASTRKAAGRPTAPETEEEPTVPADPGQIDTREPYHPSLAEMATRDVLAAYQAMSEEEQTQLVEALRQREQLKKRVVGPNDARKPEGVRGEKEKRGR